MHKPMAWALFWIGLFIVGLGAQNASAASVRQDDSKAQWAKVVSAAQQEGKVVIYGAPATPWRKREGGCLCQPLDPPPQSVGLIRC